MEQERSASPGKIKVLAVCSRIRLGDRPHAALGEQRHVALVPDRELHAGGREQLDAGLELVAHTRRLA